MAGSTADQWKGGQAGRPQQIPPVLREGVSTTVLVLTPSLRTGGGGRQIDGYV